MPKFKYIARDSAGRSSSGLIEPRDQSDLRHILRVNDLYLTQFKPMGKVDPQVGDVQPGLFSGRAKSRDIVIIVRQMATLVRAGVPLADGLASLHLQAEKAQITS